MAESALMSMFNLTKAPKKLPRILLQSFGTKAADVCPGSGLLSKDISTARISGVLSVDFGVIDGLIFFQRPHASCMADCRMLRSVLEAGGLYAEQCGHPIGSAEGSTWLLTGAILV